MGGVTLTTGPRYADQLDYPLLHRGKVRELYRYDADRLLMVATDQISAFDYVLDSTIPDKGAVLTQLSQWWFGQLTDIVDNHVLSTDVPEAVRGRAVDLRAAGDDPGRVRGPRLPDRLRLAGVPAVPVGVRGPAARRACTTGPGWTSRSSPRRPRPRWASTTRTCRTRSWSTPSAPRWPSGSGS